MWRIIDEFDVCLAMCDVIANVYGFIVSDIFAVDTDTIAISFEWYVVGIVADNGL
jgi:hypothetical protein